MGYSTTIYAVDLDKLKAAVGSGDARLLRRVGPAKKAKAGKKAKEEVLRVLVNKKSEIHLNGQQVSFDELVAEVSRPKWKWNRVFWYEAPPPRTGRWRREYSAQRALQPALPSRDYLNVEFCYSLKEFKSGFPDDEDDEITEEEAAAELVEGKIRRPKDAYQYGYGLERLCRVLGTLLAGIEGKGGMLKALKFNTPLSKERSPVPLPKTDDFPAIGYLTAAEVQREAARLGALDLSFPKDDEIEADRKELLRALQKAA